MLKITRLETFVIGDGPEIDPDKGSIEPLACLRVHTDDGLTGFSEVFRVPPGVVQATVGGPETHFGRLLIGQEITHPEWLWQHVWDSRLAELTSIPLAMGEHGVTRWEFLDMLDRGKVSVLQPYMTTCGGLTEAKRIVDLAVPRGALVCPGNWSTQILGAASVHLAAYSPITPFIEFAPAEVFDSPLRRELQEAGLPVKNGVIEFPNAPGIGFQFPEHLAAKYRIA